MFEDCVLQSMRFPQKLWRIINECKTGTIRWGANGNTILLDYKRFQTEYLDARRPIFKTSNITSFIRQLNLYGFRKVTSHSRDPICNSCNQHVHEFLHDNFRVDRMDLLSKVCRKTSGKGKCLQHDAIKNAGDSPQLEKNCVSRLKLCQLALTQTLEQITQEYRREHEKKSIVMKDNSLKKTSNFQNIVPVLYEIEFNNVSNRKPIIERSAKYSTFFPSKTDEKLMQSSKHRTVPSTWRIATMNKYGLHFKIQNIH